MKSMRKLSLLILFTLSTGILLAQNQLATTKDGKIVILKTNGTWEYAKDNKNASTLTKKAQTKPVDNISRNNANATQKIKKSTPTQTTKISRMTYITGPRGGCYYINSNGNKTYVDRSFCK